MLRNAAAKILMKSISSQGSISEDVNYSLSAKRNTVAEFNAFNSNPRITATQPGMFKAGLRGRKQKSDLQLNETQPKKEGLTGMRMYNRHSIGGNIPAQPMVSPGKVHKQTLNRLFELSFKLEGISAVPMEKLRSNSQLKTLDLSHNKLVNLPNEIFWLLPNIQKLSLDYNQLTSLPRLDTED